MRMITKSVVALGFIGAMAGATVTTSSAQGIYSARPGLRRGHWPAGVPRALLPRLLRL